MCPSENKSRTGVCTLSIKSVRMLLECLECCSHLIKRYKTKRNKEGGSVIYHVEQTEKRDMSLHVGGTEP